jgi:stage III sporulation protein AB
VVRQLGALAVFSSLSWCGFARARWYRRRLACLAQWQQALLEGERMLCDLGQPTLDYLIWMQTQPQLASVGRACLSSIRQEQPFGTAWRSSLGQAGLPLGRDELQTLAELGNALGRLDSAQQRVALQSARLRLSRYQVAAEEDRQRLGRMWSALGVCAGVLAVVLLY